MKLTGNTQSRRIPGGNPRWVFILLAWVLAAAVPQQSLARDPAFPGTAREHSEDATKESSKAYNPSGAVAESPAAPLSPPALLPAISIEPAGPPLGEFPEQLWRNFKGLFSSESLKPLLIGAGATGASSFWDGDVQEYFGSTRRFKELGEVGAVVGHPVTLGALTGSLLLTGYNSNSTRLQSMSFSLAQGFVLDYGMTALFKGVTSRERPNGEGQTSFPSGHTSASVMTAAVFSHYYPKATIPAFLTAGLVGVSRLEKNKHYVSDVVAGATLGYIVGRTVVRGTAKMRKHRRVDWAPVVLPEGGVAVTMLLNPRP